MRRAVIPGAILCAICAVNAAHAETEPVEALRRSVELLTRRVQEMEAGRAADQRRIRELEERIERGYALAAPAPVPAPVPTPARADQGNLLNPQITAFFDMGASVSTDGDNQEHNRFNLRETELDFRAPVSPRADGVLVVAIGEEIEDPFGATEIDFAFELEEAYLNVHTLPGDLSARAGKFRNAFGRNNLLHTHDLPQVSRPLAVQAFLGPEGLSTVGASVDWLVPNPWDRYVELTAQLVNADGGAESPILGGPQASDPAVISHLKLYQDVGDSGGLELGGSLLHGHTSSNRHATGTLLGADATWLWRDPARPDFRSFLVQGELFWAKSDFDDPVLGIIRDDYLGLYVFGQLQLRQHWYAGLRYDYTEFPNLESRRRSAADWAASAYLTWYLNEALRLRLEYQHLERDLIGESDHQDALLLGMTFHIGAHPAHPYWVNR